MKIEGFDEARILSELSQLPERHRVAYASACAERLLPLYAWFERVESWGDSLSLNLQYREPGTG
jgi:P2-related tail formation protein